MRRLYRQIIAVTLMVISSSASLSAQTGNGEDNPVAALRTNLLYDAALVPNLGAEIAIGSRWSAAVDLCGAWWGGPGHKRSWRIYGGEAGARFYLTRSERLTGHHIGAYFQCYTYDFKLGERGYIGGRPSMNIFHNPTLGVGLEYGYTLKLTGRLALDFSIGAGWSGGRCEEFHTVDGRDITMRSFTREWWGPTRAAVALIYRFNS